ncbi:hypothetical protein D3C83_26650 [compost metagenome]
MERDARERRRRARSGRAKAEQAVLLRVKNLADVFCEFGDAPRLFGIGGIEGERVAIVFDHYAAAARRDHDRFRAPLDIRPPRIDIPAHVAECLVLRAEMKRHRPAAAGVRRAHERDAKAIEHARGGGIGRRRKARLHAAFQHQHLA